MMSNSKTNVAIGICSSGNRKVYAGFGYSYYVVAVVADFY